MINQGKLAHAMEPSQGNSSFELQRNPQEEQHSRWGEQKILYCSFETVPTQFPQSRASNSFSILTVPHYCLSRETPNLSPSGHLISRDSKDTIAKSTQIVLGKQKLIFLKKKNHSAVTDFTTLRLSICLFQDCHQAVSFQVHMADCFSTYPGLP